MLLGSSPYPHELSRDTLAARSFVITDPEVLAAFTFDRVIRSLPFGPSAVGLEPLVPPQETGHQRPVIMPMSGFIAAPEDGYWRPAGADDWSYVRPVAIVNRFDLAPSDYANCGEYRLIFSRRSDGRARLNIAVEAVVPNPAPRKGKAGCADVATFWWELAAIDSAAARRDRLERFFFDGGALERQNFERGSRIRTSEISEGRPKFAQFELKRRCASTQPCRPQFARVPLDNMPDGALFDADAAGEPAAAFRREFLRQVASLSIPDVNRYSMNVDPAYSVSDVEALVPAFNYRLPFQRAQRTAVGREFRVRIAEELRKAGSTLTPEDIIDRAETQNCAGCHGKPGPVGGGIVFPKAFEHGEHIAGEWPPKSARLSPALEEVFVPYRIGLLREYLRSVAADATP